MIPVHTLICTPRCTHQCTLSHNAPPLTYWKYNLSVRFDREGALWFYGQMYGWEEREGGVERIVLNTCCVLSPLLGVGGEERGIMWFLSWGSLHSSSWFSSSLSWVVGTGSSSGGHVSINWMSDQLVRELRSELFLLSQQSQEPYFCSRRSAYLFFY